MTVNEHIDTVMRVMLEQYGTRTGESKRWLGLAIEALEEAQTRYNGAQYHDRGTFHRVDPDKDPAEDVIDGQMEVEA